MEYYDVIELTNKFGDESSGITSNPDDGLCLLQLTSKMTCRTEVFTGTSCSSIT